MNGRKKPMNGQGEIVSYLQFSPADFRFRLARQAHLLTVAGMGLRLEERQPNLIRE